MRLCICDDEMREREEIRRFCRQFFDSRGIACEIRAAKDASEVLSLVDEIDLLVLDIEMPGMDGVTLKDRLQRRNSKCLILFVTSHDEMMPEAFGMQVIGFIEKSQLLSKLPRYLTLGVNIIGRDVLIEERYHSRDVVRIHSEREYCNLYFKDGATVLIRSSLTKLEAELKEVDFVRVNRAWLVNLEYVEDLAKKEVSVAGEVISVSRGCSERLHKAYEVYCERNARYC